MDVQAPDTETDAVPAAPNDNAAHRERNLALIVVVAVILLAAGLNLIRWDAAAIILGAILGLFAVRRIIMANAHAAARRALQDADEVKRLQRYSKLLDSLPQPVILLSGKDQVETANAAARRQFGDVIGTHIASIIRAPAALGTLREARHAGEPREEEFTLAAPHAFSGLFYAAPFEDGSDEAGKEMLVMIRDRTEQKMLERMRTDFIANAGHELRTPLSSILGFIETLQGHARDDPEAQARFLKIMKSQTERLLRLVRDLVSLSALELNERRLPAEAVDLCEVAATVRELLAPVAEKAGGEIVPGPTDCNAWITGDRDQMVQVIQNLADNALKYGGAGGGIARVHVSVGRGPRRAFDHAAHSGDSPEQIAVRAGCEPDQLIFVRVRDEGPGIPVTDLPRLTERFYRTDVERSHTQPGTGLGLAIVKHIVGRHRGGILIESSEGEGAAFTCYFPPKSAIQADPLTTGG